MSAVALYRKIAHDRDIGIGTPQTIRSLALRVPPLSHLTYDDVEPDMGALEYIPATQTGGHLEGVHPQRLPAAVFIPDAERRRTLSNEPIVCSGRAGTLVLADTSGFHRGGRPTTGPRLLFTAVYLTDGAVERTPRWKLGHETLYSHLDVAAKHAVRLG